MSITNFEIAFRHVITGRALTNCLADFLQITPDNIVDADAYWVLDAHMQKTHIGVTVCHSGRGLRTLLKGVSGLALEGELLGELAFYYATRLKTEAVIGDHTYPDPRAQDRSLIYFPDGSCARCIDNWDAASQVNEVELAPFGRLPVILHK